MQELESLAKEPNTLLYFWVKKRNTFQHGNKRGNLLDTCVSGLLLSLLLSSLAVPCCKVASALLGTETECGDQRQRRLLRFCLSNKQILFHLMKVYISTMEIQKTPLQPPFTLLCWRGSHCNRKVPQLCLPTARAPGESMVSTPHLLALPMWSFGLWRLLGQPYSQHSSKQKTLMIIFQH